MPAATQSGGRQVVPVRDTPLRSSRRLQGPVAILSPAAPWPADGLPGPGCSSEIRTGLEAGCTCERRTRRAPACGSSTAAMAGWDGSKWQAQAIGLANRVVTLAQTSASGG